MRLWHKIKRLRGHPLKHITYLSVAATSVLRGSDTPEGIIVAMNSSLIAATPFNLFVKRSLYCERAPVSIKSTHWAEDFLSFSKRRFETNLRCFACLTALNSLRSYPHQADTLI